MLTPLAAAELFQREFLEIRAKILQLAAHLDRLDRAPGDMADDGRRDTVQRGLALLLEPDAGRAERVQLLFSRPYDPQ